MNNTNKELPVTRAELGKILIKMGNYISQRYNGESAAKEAVRDVFGENYLIVIKARFSSCYLLEAFFHALILLI